MKASETKFQPIIEGTKQYVVPLFQRPYSWKKDEWAVLWRDLLDLCENEEPKYHFIGSLVTMPTTSVPEGISKYLLIDGQQRLTTIFILLTLLRDLAEKQKSNQLADEINDTLIVNRFKKDLDYFKLLPTQQDRAAFQGLIRGTGPDPKSGLVACYKYFERVIRKHRADITKLKNVITSRLSVVSIVLDDDDNPHLVFESLNAKGRPLTQSDLIRNHFFMCIHVDQHNEVHDQYWQPMQSALGESMTEFIRHYLMKDGKFVKGSEVYFTLKDRLKGRDALDALKEISQFAEHYRQLLYPEDEPSPRLRYYLTRLNRLETTTAYPFLLNCYQDYEKNILPEDEFVEILRVIENYIIRRYVCSIPTNSLNKIFPVLYSQARHDRCLSGGVKRELQKRDYPKDAEFRERLVKTRLYGGPERLAKTRVILESLEAALRGKEQAALDETITIEHIMPQTLTPWWRDHLGEQAEVDHKLTLHTLGNLTLTGYNKELSNAPYPDKCKYFANSGFELNRYFQDVPTWRRQDIEARGEHLADLALKIWPYFGDKQTNIITPQDVTRKSPRRVTILGRTYVVKFWRDVLVKVMNTLAEIDPEGFELAAQEYPALIGRDPNRFRDRRQLENGLYVQVNLSAEAIDRFCTNMIESVGLSSDDWRVELA
ncbi:MAG: DUF262 domain-containing protein [Aggregatilineales bacterium]